MTKPHCKDHMRFSAQCEECAALFEAEQKKKVSDNSEKKHPIEEPKDASLTKKKKASNAKKTTSKKQIEEKKAETTISSSPTKIKPVLSPVFQTVTPVGRVSEKIVEVESTKQYVFFFMAATMAGSMLLLFRKIN